MKTGLKTTFEVLSASRNASAGPALITALESSDSAVYDGALKALISRRSKAGHLAVLKKWHTLAPHQREFLQKGKGRISGALRDAVLSEDSQLFQNACELVEEFSEFDLVPTLVTLAENQKSEHAQAATDLVLRLVDRLSEMVHGPRDSNVCRDPESIRRYVFESLERSVERFRHHQRSELIEAFVVLGGPSCEMLRAILDDPYHACYKTVVDALSTSESKGVIELLINFLMADLKSLSVLNVISRRTDEGFIARLLECADDEFLPRIAKNLSRIRSFAWLDPESPCFFRFEEKDQARCVRLVVASGMKESLVLDFLKVVLKNGEPAARLAACEALASIQGDAANRLVLEAVEDIDPYVQASAARQLRERHLPGTMATLLKLIDSPHKVVQEATREALSEFSFENFLIRFETLHDDARQSTAALVRKVDPDTTSKLLSEMKNRSRKRRMRAIEMAEVMGLVPHVSEGLIERLEEDEDHLVRAAAADALQLCPTPIAKEALQHALADRSPAVQNAAKDSLTALASIAENRMANAMSTVEGLA